MLTRQRVCFLVHIFVLLIGTSRSLLLSPHLPRWWNHLGTGNQKRSAFVPRTHTSSQLAGAASSSSSTRLFYTNNDTTRNILKHDDLPLSSVLGVDQNGNGSINGTIKVLDQGIHHVVVAKPPSVVCHHSEWTGSKQRGEIPMLQRIRQSLGRRINLVHRLDRGASGCLLCAFADEQGITTNQEEQSRGESATAALSQAMSDVQSNKTYLALVRGEGILYGHDLKKLGWFRVTRPITDEDGKYNTASTWFRFVAGQPEKISDDGAVIQPRVSVVLAKPQTGRWHQVRKHLKGLSHPILGDSSHGSSKLNRQWRDDYGLLPERTCLHLARMQLPPSWPCPEGMDVACPLPKDFMHLFASVMPTLWEEARPLLEQEGIMCISEDDAHKFIQALPFQMQTEEEKY